MRSANALLLCLVAAVLAACASGGAQSPSPGTSSSASPGTSVEQPDGTVLARGRASWYGLGFHGRKTANGEKFDMHAYTAAHPTLPFGTRVLVRNPSNGRSVIVRINDRGPYTGGRIIDVSFAAARALGIVTLGTRDVVLVEAPAGAELGPVKR